MRVPSSIPVPALGDAWRRVVPALQLFGSLLGVSFAAGILGRRSASPWVDVATTFASALLVCNAAWDDRGALLRTWRIDERARRGLPWRKTTLVLGATVICVLSYFALLERLHVPFVRLTSMFVLAGWPRWTTGVLLVLCPALFEELAFRGIILPRLQPVLGNREAWLVQAAMFSVLHVMPLMFPSHFVLGLALGWLRLRSGRLGPGILAHAVWNAAFVVGELAQTNIHN